MPTSEFDGKYVGEKVLEEGAYTTYNALKYFFDKERKYPYRIPLGFNEMLESLTFEIHGEKLTLPQIIANLETGETFSWIIYASFNHPLNESMLELEILPSPDMAGFLTVKINPQISEQKPLKTPSNFKLLVTFTKNSAWEEFLKRGKNNVAFGIRGKGRRTGTS